MTPRPKPDAEKCLYQFKTRVPKAENELIRATQDKHNVTVRQLILAGVAHYEALAQQEARE